MFFVLFQLFLFASNFSFKTRLSLGKKEKAGHMFFTKNTQNGFILLHPLLEKIYGFAILLALNCERKNMGGCTQKIQLTKKPAFRQGFFWSIGCLK